MQQLIENENKVKIAFLKLLNCLKILKISKNIFEFKNGLNYCLRYYTTCTQNAFDVTLFDCYVHS